MKRFKKPTTLRTRFNQLVGGLNDNFRGVGEEFDDVYQRISEFREEFNELRDELATNGVVRDLVKLRRDHEELRSAVLGLRRELDDLGRNGVATAVNRLNAEVFGEKTSGETSALERVMYAVADAEPAQKATLRGKLDAVIEHLGIDVSVKPREVIESKIVTKKIKTTKKGKK